MSKAAKNKKDYAKDPAQNRVFILSAFFQQRTVDNATEDTADNRHHPEHP